MIPTFELFLHPIWMSFAITAGAQPTVFGMGTSVSARCAPSAAEPLVALTEEAVATLEACSRYLTSACLTCATSFVAASFLPRESRAFPTAIAPIALANERLLATDARARGCSASASIRLKRHWKAR